MRTMFINTVNIFSQRQVSSFAFIYSVDFLDPHIHSGLAKEWSYEFRFVCVSPSTDPSVNDPLFLGLAHSFFLWSCIKLKGTFTRKTLWLFCISLERSDKNSTFAEKPRLKSFLVQKIWHLLFCPFYPCDVITRKWK